MSDYKLGDGDYIPKTPAGIQPLEDFLALNALLDQEMERILEAEFKNHQIRLKKDAEKSKFHDNQFWETPKSGYDIDELMADYE